MLAYLTSKSPNSVFRYTQTNRGVPLDQIQPNEVDVAEYIRCNACYVL